MSSAAHDRVSWQRRHSEGGSMALAIWVNGRCEASVYEAPGLLRVPERVACETTAEARVRADGLLKRAYPHDCEASGCEPWGPFARDARVCGC
jgi:hypothetical protein